MDSAVAQVAFLFWILILLAVWIVAARQMGILPQTGARVATWLALTGVTLWFGYTVAFIGVHVVLFTLGTLAAAISFLVATALLAATPFVWAWVMHRMGHQVSAHG